MKVHYLKKTSGMNDFTHALCDSSAAPSIGILSFASQAMQCYLNQKLDWLFVRLRVHWYAISTWLKFPLDDLNFLFQSFINHMESEINTYRWYRQGYDLLVKHPEWWKITIRIDFHSNSLSLKQNPLELDPMLSNVQTKLPICNFMGF